jgi:hypothetical protein
MTPHSCEYDDILLDRLVDGELNPLEQRSLLTSLDNREDGWRKCALAFLEAQSLRRELTDLVSDVPAPVNQSAGMPMSVGHRRPRWGWLALAASLALAFALGALVPSRQPPREAHVAPPVNGATEAIDKAPVEPSASDVANSESSVARDSIDASNALRLWVRNFQGQAEPLHVPLVDATTLNQQLGLEFRSGISDELRQQLAAEGYRVESRQRYAPLWIDQDRPLVVPVEDTKIVPISWQVY